MNVRELVPFLEERFKPDDATIGDVGDFSRVIGLLGQSPEGRRALRSRSLQGWFDEYLRARRSYMDSAASIPLIDLLVRMMPKGAMKDFMVPKGGFGSFNEFFSRKLRSEARPIECPGDDRIVVSPADANATFAFARPAGRALLVKDGIRLSIPEMLGSSRHSRRFERGTALGFLLTPLNYHRFHSPVSGTILERRGARGNYLAFMEPDFTARQYRGHYVISTPRHGLVAFIAFGMSVVESVNLTASARARVSKGDDLGYFLYGGSYVVLGFEEGVVPSGAFARKPAKSRLSPYPGTPVRMGKAIARFR